MRVVEARLEDHASHTGDSSAARSWSTDRIFIAIAVCAVLVFLALAVGTALTSRPITDEGLFADPAYTLATRGYMGSPALRDNIHLLHIEQRTYWIFPLDPLMQAAWYRLFGPGLLAMRSLSICFGLLGLGALFAFVERLSRDSRIAAVAVGLTALDYLYIYGSASGRMDVICAALGYAGLASYMALRERNLVLAVFLGQSMIVASGTTHPNGFLYFMGLLLLIFYFDRGRLAWQHFAVAVIPYVVGASLWGFYIFQDPAAFVAQLRSNVSDGGRLQGFGNPIMGFVREITVRYATGYGLGAHSAGHHGPIYLKALGLIPCVVGITGALSIPSLRRKIEVKVLLSLISIYFVYLAISDGQKAYYYIIHFIPMYDALLAIFLCWLLLNRKVNSVAILLPLALILALESSGLAYRIRLDSYKNIYRPAVRYLKQNARGSQLINANISFLFGLNFPDNLIDDSHLREKADFFVIDDEIAQRLQNSKTANPTTYSHVTGLLASCYEKVYNANSVVIYALRRAAGNTCR
jgi:Dolichyl-phosphate-mannose-protein mannosyltransferase